MATTHLTPCRSTAREYPGTFSSTARQRPASSPWPEPLRTVTGWSCSTTTPPSTRPCASSTSVPRSSPPLVEELRTTLLRAAAQAGRDVVSTLVFADPFDRPHVARLVTASASGGAATAFVQLLPARAMLEERVLDPSRCTTSKIKDLGTLARVLDCYDLETPINDDDLRIDNADLGVNDVVCLIAEQLVLGSD